MPNAQEIANTILSQLQATMGMNVILSWGICARQFLTERNLEQFGLKGEGALKFKVNGHHHKGHVLVVLTYSDLYDVYICNIRKNKITVKEECKGMFFEDIGDYIDKQVEYIPAYSA